MGQSRTSYAYDDAMAPARDASPRASARRRDVVLPGEIPGWQPPVAPVPSALHIVSDDPEEIRLYAEAQRNSRTGATAYADAPSSPQDAPAPMRVVTPRDPEATPSSASTKPSARSGLADHLGSAIAKAKAVLADERTWHMFLYAITLAACTLAAIIMLYFPAQEFYLAVRENERLTDELARNTERNEQMLNRVTALQTAEGIQDEAHAVYGLELPGEHSVTVVGVETQQRSSSIPTRVVRGSGSNTHTWATDLLDGVFGATGADEREASIGDRATVIEESAPDDGAEG